MRETTNKKKVTKKVSRVKNEVFGKVPRQIHKKVWAEPEWGYKGGHKAPKVREFYDQNLVANYLRNTPQEAAIGTVSIDPKSLSNPRHDKVKYSFISGVREDSNITTEIDVIKDINVKYKLQHSTIDSAKAPNKRIMVAHWSGNTNVILEGFQRTLIGQNRDYGRVRVLCVPNSDFNELTASSFYKYLTSLSNFAIYSYTAVGTIGGVQGEVATFSIMRESMKTIVKDLAVQITPKGMRQRKHCMMVDLDLSNELHADLAMHSDDEMSDVDMPVRQHFATSGKRVDYPNLRDAYTQSQASDMGLVGDNNLMKVPFAPKEENQKLAGGRPAEQAVSVSFDSQYFSSLFACGEDVDMEEQGKLWLQKQPNDFRNLPIINRNQYMEDTKETAINKVMIWNNVGTDPSASGYNKIKNQTEELLLKTFENLIFELNWGPDNEGLLRVRGNAKQLGGLVAQLSDKFYKDHNKVYQLSNLEKLNKRQIEQMKLKRDKENKVITEEYAKGPNAHKLTSLIMTRAFLTKRKRIRAEALKNRRTFKEN